MLALLLVNVDSATWTSALSWQRLLYCLLNSLIIFSVGVGSHSVSGELSGGSGRGAGIVTAPLFSALVPDAYAQPKAVDNSQTDPKPKPSDKPSSSPPTEFKAPSVVEDAQRMSDKKFKESDKFKEQRRFFSPWFDSERK